MNEVSRSTSSSIMSRSCSRWVGSSLGRAERLEAELDRGERALELVRDRVDEAVLAPDLEDLANEEDAEQHEDGHDDDERDRSEHEERDLAADLLGDRDPLGEEDAPPDEQRSREDDSERAEGDRKRDRLATTPASHGRAA